MQHSKMKAAAVIAISALALAGCSASGGDSSGTGGEAAACTPADGDVTLEFTSWIPGIEDVVEIWNEANPEIQVDVQTGPNGNGGTYQNFFNQIKAGDAPDLGQIEYDALPNFLVQDGLEDLSGCEDVVAAEDQFVDWAWGQVTLGTEGVYGVPQDTGPMALFYRADLFEQNGIAIPTTWDEYREAAVKIRDLGGYITNFSQSDINQFAGFAWQDGAQWFSSDDEGWTVSLADDATTTVADFWQSMLDDDLVATVPAWTDEWNNAYNSGQVWTWNSAVWGANSISSGAPDTAGSWAVAPLPQWEAGGTAAGNWGGSSTAVLKGSEHVYEATKFALWLNTSDEALTALAEAANLYPATTAGLELPVYAEGVEFYGGQKIYDVFADAATQVSPDFAWGPTMTQTYSDVSDGFKAAVSGNGTLLDAIEKGQTATIDALKAASIPVTE
ncbi:extracellular solute-binding protein [Microbacterium sp. CFBP9023]|uniref:ABC transporter substrate-binding protein n=1 Tax=unclassified Microbacterium TaxID=2609290 RepID=UPI0006F848F0|nr:MULTISPECIES: extracellular solute-binding protein [unclassified Microbacterium]KRD53631.1 sugar ABC transporter substrate-binding protein [Microbacterium sp. Root280D1]MDY0983641.1 extracellular solute-binding protein [Microbacterium sp. CFBP9023]